ncbi:apses-domain-containing protein [Linnemannia elongata]|nr:apses-domain-containing protein [Linnemannia elongata]
MPQLPLDDKPVHDAPIGPSQIFKATYSGVPVYEMICKGVAVMRRRSDSYLNATQILKVADFDKPQRTRILEREVQKGEHEKVQGGYGKYQGTWVPYERGLQLCQEYNVVHLLQPILEYQATKTSPPLAPKHITAASNRPRKPREPRPPGSTPVGTPKMKKTKIDIAAQILPKPMDLNVGLPEIGYTPFEEGDTGTSRTPSPPRSHDDLSTDDASDKESRSSYSSNSRTRASDQDQDQDDRKSTTSSIATATATLTASGDVLARGPHAEILLEYFISDSPGLPTLLTQPPSDLDVNVVIDEEGHTALHWAAAMAKPDVIRLLIQLGADTYRVNTDGQTALMRSVLFSNNFEQKEFITLLELLQKTIFTIDKDDQTVFHHVAITAGQRGKIHAARYYLECLLAKLAKHPSELASIINVQDREGDTALTIAARLKIGGKKVVKMLLDAGADAKIRNHLGKNAEDYIQETEQAISSAVASTAAAAAAAAAAAVSKNGNTNGHAANTATTRGATPAGPGVTSLTASTRNVVIPTVSDLFGQLTHSYEKDIFEKDQDIVEARNLLQGMQSEIWEGRRTILGLKSTASTLKKADEEIRELEKKIKQEIHIRQRLRLEELIHEQEEEGLKHKQPVNGETTATKATLPAVLLSGRAQQPLKNEAEILRSKLEELQKKRKERVDEMVALKSHQGKRRHEYQRLIALCCNVSLDQVDGLLQPLLTSLGGDV